MNATTSHRLDGLEPDNLLSFLALLGLLRTLETAEPGWSPRIHWEGRPLRPVLSLSTAVPRTQLCTATAAGCARLSGSYEFGDRDMLNYRKDELRKLEEEAWDAGSEVWRQWSATMAPLAHENALKLNDNELLESSPFNCLDVAQTKFLKEFRKAVATDTNTANDIEKAIFEVWRREDNFARFRWDHAEDRRHAYRYRAPTADPPRTVAGANRLAAFGLALMPGVAVEWRGRIRLATLGSRHVPGVQIQITWPVWSVPASRSGIQAILAHPELAEHEPDMAVLGRLNIIGVYRTRKISVGKYRSFTRAVAL
jgi:hypothetical protein